MALFDKLQEMIETAVTHPTIHLNGSAKSSLMKDYSRAYDALTTAQEELAKCGPNGRDYYPQGDNALRSAQNEHRERMIALDKITKEVMEIMIKIDEQEGR